MTTDQNLGEVIDVVFSGAWGDEVFLSVATGPKRFTDLFSSLKIPPSTLTRRLNEMCTANIVKREFDSVERTEKYVLTKRGEDVVPFVRSIDELKRLAKDDMPSIDPQIKLAIIELLRMDVEKIRNLLAESLTKISGRQYTEEEVKRVIDHILSKLRDQGGSRNV